MYSLIMIAALAQGTDVPSAGDLPASAAVAPPGAVGSVEATPAPPAQKPGFFSRLFGCRAKDAPATPAVVPPAQPVSPPPAATTAAQPKHGFLYNFFHSTDYDPNFDKTRKWEKAQMLNPD